MTERISCHLENVQMIQMSITWWVSKLWHVNVWNITQPWRGVGRWFIVPGWTLTMLWLWHNALWKQQVSCGDGSIYVADPDRQILRHRKWILVARTLERGLQYGDWSIINTASLENGGALGPGCSESLTQWILAKLMGWAFSDCDFQVSGLHPHTAWRKGSRQFLETVLLCL